MASNMEEVARGLVPHTKVGPYSLKGLKTLRGQETPCFEATLLEDGKAVAFVRNDGRGGMSYVDPPLKSSDEAWAAFRRDGMDALLARMDAVARRDMKPMDFDGTPLPYNWDSMLCTMVENASMLKSLKAGAKKGQTVLVHPGKPDEYQVVRILPTDERLPTWIQKNMPGAVVLNDFLQEA